MVIMYCNLVKTQAFPLISKISSRQSCLKPSLRFKTQSFPVGSNGFNPKPSDSFNKLNPTTNLDNFQVVQPRKFSSRVYRKEQENHDWVEKKTRNFSNGVHVEEIEQRPRVNYRGRNFSNGEDRVRGTTRKTLPWISGNKTRQGKSLDKVSSKESSRSSWVESADNFLSKNGGNESIEIESRVRRVDTLETRNESVEKDESWVPEEKDEEVVDDNPRWDRIRTRYRRVNDNEYGFENPDNRRWNKQEDWGRKTWKEATESTLPKMSGEGIYGVGPVLAALSSGRREFYTLYVQEGLDLSSNNRKKKDKKGFEKVLRIAKKLGLPTKETPKHDLNMLVDNRPHQGLVLDASPLEMIKIRELEPVGSEAEKGQLWVALDEVTDPQNLGAIIRSSYFFGAQGVILCAKNSAPLSGVVSKASAGSLELMELRSCKNMMQFLTSSADNGWRVLGGSVSSRAIPLNEIPPGAPTILVLGSEGTGLRPLVERSCTDLVRIPGNIPLDITAVDDEDENTGEVDRGCSGEEFRSFLAVESLNVSVAAGVLLHHLVGNYNDHHLGNNLDNVLD